MLSKFSVKKPYTVIVGIVLILVLGIVSFRDMTTDLLPDINMPYAIVVTTYVGASPSQVEEAVSEPIEQSMATVSNIKNVQSVSSENYSMVILEFEQTADMDSVSLEMREKLDQLEGSWDESVGNPTIMKINPDMMPVMVSAVEKDGMDSIALTEYAENELLGKIESLEGVASAEASGEVEQTVQVILRQDKIDEVNEKVQGALNGTFAEAQGELDDARGQLQEGRDQLESGKQAMTDQLSQAAGAQSQIEQGEAQLAEAENQIEQKERELSEARTQLEIQKASLEAGTPVKNETYQAAYQQAYDAALTQAYAEADSQAESALTEQAAQLEAAIAQLQEQIARLEAAQGGQNGEAQADQNQTEQEVPGQTEQAGQSQTSQEVPGQTEQSGQDQTDQGVQSQAEQAGQSRTAQASQNQTDQGSQGQPEQAREAITADGASVSLPAGEARLLSGTGGGAGENGGGFLPGLPGSDSAQSGDAGLAQLKQQLAAQQEALAYLNSEEGKAAARAEAEAAAKELLDAGFEAQFNAQYCPNALEAVNQALAQLDGGQAQLDAAKAQLASTREQLVQGKISLSEAQAQIESAKIEATLQLAAAQAQLDAGEAQLEEGQAQLDESKEAAMESADLSGKITIDTITQMLTAQNFSMPAGYITEDGVKYLVRVGDKFTSMEEMQALVLFDLGIEGLEPIKLTDVADVSVTDNSAEVYAKVDGQDALLLTMQKQTGYSTGEVSDRLNKFFDELMEQDDSVHVTTMMDQGIYIDMVVDSVLQNLGYGAVLAVLILFLFLKDIRPTAVVACSIPISVLTAVVLMYFSGITLNVISLSGLALGVGMLVDNSIVVIENIYRLHRLGIPVRKAAVQGAKQMTGAIVASTLTTVCVFAPIVFTEGITRQLFVDMGLTIAYSLLASLAVALTFVPMMASGLLKRKKETRSRILDAMIEKYGKAARWALGHKAAVLLGAVAIFALSMYLCLAKGFTFMPEMESTQASVTVTMPEESTVAETGAMTDQVMERLGEISDVEEIGAMVSGDSTGMMGGDSNSATMYLILKENKELSGDELEEEILQRTEDLDCEISVSASMMDLSALGGSGVSIQIKGKDMDTLQQIASDVAELVRETEGTLEVSDGMEETSEEFRLIVRKDAAAEHNLTVAQVYMAVQEKLAESQSATVLSTDTKDYDVDISSDLQKEYTRDDIRNMTITATGTDGTTEEVPVSELVDFEDTQGVASIQRDAQSRYLTVSAGVDDSHNVTLVSNEIKEKLNAYEMPEGYSWKMTGEDETISSSMDDLLLMLLLALIFMYLIMVAQFQSLLSPFIVMFTIPLAFTGGFLGLLVSGSELSVIAMIGFIMLCGIIVNNGIVLVDYINQLRAAGMEKREAIVTAGKTRMRPILMTALTTILGLATMAVGVGMGADMTQPMAVVTIGGLLYGTLLTLFVVPCIYDIFNRRHYTVIRDSELDAADEELDLMRETNLTAEDIRNDADGDEEGMSDGKDGGETPGRRDEKKPGETAGPEAGANDESK